MILTVILLTIAGAIIAAMVGTFWYSPMTPMGRLHMKTLGFDKLSKEEQQKQMEEVAPKMWKYYVAQLVLALLLSLATVFIIMMSVQNGVSFMLAMGFVLVNWLTFMVPAIGTQVLWSNIDRSIAWQKFFSDIAMNLVTLLLISFLTSFFV